MPHKLEDSAYFPITDCMLELLADAYFSFAQEQPATLMLAKHAVDATPDDAARIIADLVGVLLGHWRDGIDPPERELAHSYWHALAFPSIRRKLAEEVKKRFSAAADPAPEQPMSWHPHATDTLANAFAHCSPEFWRPLAEAYHASLSGMSGAMEGIRIALANPDPYLFTSIVSGGVNTVLVRWRDSGDSQQTEQACYWWSLLRHDGARAALAQAVRERFAREG